MEITVDIIKQIIHPKKGNHEVIEGLVPALNAILPEYGIDNYLRVCHFLGQSAHETDGFNTLEEYASGRAYEGRKDLGNVVHGDGPLFKGRGIFQLTGRANYKLMSGKLGVDMIEDPDLASDPENSVKIACMYWNAKKLSEFADNDDINTITHKINGGHNGLEDRIRCTNNAKEALADQFPDEVAAQEE